MSFYFQCFVKTQNTRLF